MTTDKIDGTAADVTSAAKLVSSGAKFAEQGVKLLRQAGSGCGASGSTAPRSWRR
ncbi:hypothetical protein ABZ816_09245 [Actinosynnema sp. NPDC047251]|uniref:Uncharacterized protein n=1 Tax=Saccharothrix espanaensis (strain ATCC 51144 / DSM 44229 / JCM 9112 / NBRC 15066 / NRRL 15764) TaxID=1179773 RepID=K0K8X2_SACES|nr:hypothetical protein [Saccharothrix espanaensis]CCH33997.1 hypothetical protein BN6_67600 [Saccharothrix espanaensis DSM 44229]